MPASTKQSELVGYLVKCKECEEDNLLTKERQGYLTHDDSQCDLCGSHGYIRIDTVGERCANCGTKLGEVTVSEW